MIVEQHVAVQRGFQFLAGMEVVGLKRFLDPPVEALDHAVGLRMRRRGEAVFNAEIGAELIELVLAGGLAFAQTEQAVGEFLPVIGQNRPDPDWAGPFQIAQKSAGIGGSLGFEDPDEHPAGCPINRHEQVAPGRFISHLRQILHIDMKVAGLVGFERLVLRSGVASLQVTQIAHPMPPQAAVEARARHIRVQELADHGQQVVDGHQQRLAQDNRHRLLRGRECCLKPVRRVAAVLHTVAMLPFVDGLLVCQENDSLDRFLIFQTPEPLRQG